VQDIQNDCDRDGENLITDKRLVKVLPVFTGDLRDWWRALVRGKGREVSQQQHLAHRKAIRR
jgi:hypothetical protein